LGHLRACLGGENQPHINQPQHNTNPSGKKVLLAGNGAAGAGASLLTIRLILSETGMELKGMIYFDNFTVT
jgi:hypothetical protein